MGYSHARDNGRWTAAAGPAALSGLTPGPDNALHLDTFKPGRFDIMGIVPVGYALFAALIAVTMIVSSAATPNIRDPAP